MCINNMVFVEYLRVYGLDYMDSLRTLKFLPGIMSKYMERNHNLNWSNLTILKLIKTKHLHGKLTQILALRQMIELCPKTI